MPNTLCKIFSEQSESYHRIKNVYDLAPFLELLQKANTLNEHNPQTKMTPAQYLTSLSKQGLPSAPDPSKQLFKEISAEEYDLAFQTFHGHVSADLLLTLDYDQNKLEWSAWSLDGLIAVTGPMDAIVKAYSSSLREKGANQADINNKALAEVLVKLCTYETVKPVEPATAFDMELGGIE